MDNIIEKIGKLYALSQNNDSIEQATMATEKAQELCFKYNLELETIIGSRRSDAIPYKMFIYELKLDDNRERFNHQCLWHVIALHNFCKVIAPRDNRVVVIGQEYNYEIVKYSYEYLAREINKLLETKLKTETFPNKHKERQFKHNFFMGAKDKIHMKLQAEFAKNVKVSNGTELVVVKDKDLDEASKKFVPQQKERQKTKIQVTEGYSQGYISADNIALKSGVESKKEGVYLP